MGATLDELRAEREKVRDEGLKVADEFDRENPEQVEALRTSAARLKELEGDIAKAEQEQADINSLRAAKAADDEAARAARPGMYSQPGERKPPEVPLSPGEQYVASDAYREWMGRFPHGGPTGDGVIAHGEGHEVGSYRSILGLQTATERFRNAAMTPDVMRALLTANDASAGTLVRPEFRGLLGPGLVRPITVPQLLTVVPVTTDAIEYVNETSRVNNAAPTAEAAALTGTTGTKPEGGLVFNVVTDTVKTIAEWVPATKRILADAPALRAYIDQYLTDDINIELEDQIISGNGTGENFMGILTHPSVPTVNTGGSNNMDRIRRAKRVIQVNGRTNPTAVVLNPENAEGLETLKSGAGTANDGGGPYYGGGPYVTQPTTIWGMVMVVTDAVPLNTAIVGDFRRAVLFDRESVTISVGTAGDDFIRNLVRVLAELRAGFGIIRPSAFAEVTLA